MACYLNQCWLLIDEARWYFAEVNFTEYILDIIHHNVSENYMLKNPCYISKIIAS